MNFLIRMTLMLGLSFLVLSPALTQSTDPIELRSNFWTGTALYQGTSKISKTDARDMLIVNPEALQLFKSGSGQKGVADVITFAGGFLIGWPLGTAIGGGDPNWGLAAIGAGVVVVAIPIYNGGIKKINQGLDLYNNGLAGSHQLTEPGYTVSLSGSGNGLGFRVQF